MAVEWSKVSERTRGDVGRIGRLPNLTCAAILSEEVLFIVLIVLIILNMSP
jgi:hypothetical protein